MKTSALATLAAFASAKATIPCVDGDYKPKCTPEGLVGTWEARWEVEPKEITFTDRRGRERTKTIRYKKGSDEADYDQIDEKCRKVARKFDSYCHQFNISDNVDKEAITPKYADFGDCDQQSEHLEQLQCLSQQCMFDYCLWRRDDWVEDCEAAVEDGTQIPQRPGWGQVYSYGNMHNDLLAGDFTSDTCTEYYEVKEDY